MKYPRTEEGWARAYASALWMAHTHKRNYTIAVIANEPSFYTVDMAELAPKPEQLAPFTAICTVTPESE